MAEKEKVFSSEVEYSGIFTFKEFYQFCYEWLTEETELKLIEKKYEEKIVGDIKNILVEWEGAKKFTDYFRFDMKVDFRITGMATVEIAKGNTKVKTNKGKIKVKVAGTLVRDYDGKFETSAFRKFLRSIYDKWVIPSRIIQFEDAVTSSCDEFLSQTKAYLDLEGKR